VGPSKRAVRKADPRWNIGEILSVNGKIGVSSGLAAGGKIPPEVKSYYYAIYFIDLKHSTQWKIESDSPAIRTGLTFMCGGCLESMSSMSVA
jgi:hypothetical protein